MEIKKYIHVLLWVKRHLLGQLHPKEVDVVVPLLRSDCLCFDVGAHSGSWSYSLSKKMGKSSIYSFEGLPYYADLLVMTMKILRRSNIRVINAAVGEEVGIVNMVWKDESGKRLTGRSHVEESGAEVGKKIQVQIIALDDFWAEIGRKKVGFVKIDVEGSELFVLKGAMELIRQCRPIFYNELEYKWCQRYDYSPSDIFKLFSDMSYSPYLIVESRIIECDMYKYAGGDVLFVPDEKVSQIDMTDLKNK